MHWQSNSCNAMAATQWLTMQLIVEDEVLTDCVQPVYNTPATQNLLKRAAYSAPYRSPYGPQ
jgi:hypothetical protein